MKTPIAVLALALAISVPANAEQETSKLAPWLVAQGDRRMPTCKQDEREVPVGTTVCREGKSLICSGRGAWEDTRKPC
jgi:hypothetical protein